MAGVISKVANAEQAAVAMRQFMQVGDETAFERAIAIYVSAARARGESLEQVLASLNALTEASHLRYQREGPLLKPTALQQMLVRGVLSAFFGEAR